MVPCRSTGGVPLCASRTPDNDITFPRLPAERSQRQVQRLHIRPRCPGLRIMARTGRFLLLRQLPATCHPPPAAPEGGMSAAPVPPGHQRCRQCGDTPPLEAFEKVYWRACGRAASCRPCMAASRDDRPQIKQIIADFVARMDAPRPEPKYRPPSGPIPPNKRLTAKDFRNIDACRRRKRLGLHK